MIDHVILQGSRLGTWGQRIYAGLNIPDSLQPAGCHGAVWWRADCAADISSVFTSGPEYDKATTCIRGPSPAAATPSICHATNNYVLSPQACSNTCWRDQLLANACNNRSPRVSTLSWEVVTITGQHQQPKFHPNPSNLTPSFIPTELSLIHSEYTLSAHLFFWLVSFYSLNKFFFLQFCLSPGPFVAAARWDLCMRSVQILHLGQCHGLNVTQLCEIWVCILCLQVTISVCNHEASQGLYISLVCGRSATWTRLETLTLLPKGEMTSTQSSEVTSRLLLQAA